MGETTATVINETFAAYGVDASVTTWVPGPSTTRYELTVGTNTKVTAVAAMAPELAMRLGVAAQHIRVALLKGRPGMGIDVPSGERIPVGIDRFELGSAHPLTLPLGVDADNESQVINVGSLPHLLVAGTTGSGKSTWLNVALSTLIERCGPEVLRLVLIDPKEVELALYADVPHLWAPIATETVGAMHVLSALTQEMDSRYQHMKLAGFKDIEAMNAAIDAGTCPGEALPYIVFAIDELADLMMTSRKSIEPLIERLTQKGRAAGIHGILCTQRPEVKVVTGIIKSNVPARLAFAVANHTDSGVILDRTGAQTLLGQGDGLYVAPTVGDPIRIQAPMITDATIRHITTTARMYYPDVEPVVGAARPQEAPQQSTRFESSGVPTNRRPREDGRYRQSYDTKRGQQSGREKRSKDRTVWEVTPRKAVIGALLVGVLIGGLAMDRNSPETPLPDPSTAYTTVPDVPTG